jgi:hypothetical protein
MTADVAQLFSLSDLFESSRFNMMVQQSSFHLLVNKYRFLPQKNHFSVLGEV